MDKKNMNINMNDDIAVTADQMKTAESLAQMFADTKATVKEKVQPLIDSTPLSPITDKTTLGELLTILELTPGQKRTGKTPTRVTLFTTGGMPIAEEKGAKVYRNGFVLYHNGIGRHTILWLPYCANFTYHFNKLRDAEKEYLKENNQLSNDLLLKTAWPVVIALFGEERITQNMFHGFGNCETEAMESENEEKNNEAVDEDDDGEHFSWDDETIGVNPLEAVIRRERRDAMLSELSDKQREVFVLHYKYGWTQKRIAEKLGISPAAVCMRLNKAKAIEKIFLKNN